MYTFNSFKPAGYKHLTLIAVLLLSSLNAYAVKAPSFSLPGSAGNALLKDKVSLDRYKGKIVYVDFWASWCVPCKKSFPWMNLMHERYASKGLKIIAINLDADKSKAQEFLNQVPADFIIAYDPEGTTAEKYDLSVMPSSYLINGKGEIVVAHRGFKGQDKSEIEEKIRGLLK